MFQNAMDTKFGMVSYAYIIQWALMIKLTTMHNFLRWYVVISYCIMWGNTGKLILNERYHNISINLMHAWLPLYSLSIEEASFDWPKLLHTVRATIANPTNKCDSCTATHTSAQHVIIIEGIQIFRNKYDIISHVLFTVPSV